MSHSLIILSRPPVAKIPAAKCLKQESGIGIMATEGGRFGSKMAMIFFSIRVYALESSRIRGLSVTFVCRMPFCAICGRLVAEYRAFRLKQQARGEII
jgi:hypothetical protein